MTQPTRIGEGARQIDARDRAISEFLDLGERPTTPLHRRRSRATAPISVEDAEALLRTIECEIIPRLMLAHRLPPGAKPRSAPDETPVGSADRERFLEILMREPAPSAARFVADLLRRGVSREAVFLDLLSHSARRLGELWEDDRCDFCDVTIGLCRLHEVLRENSVVHEEPSARALLDGPRVLLATACLDQHVFGVTMVAEFFRMAGWRVRSEPGATSDQLAAILYDENFDLLGLSVACSELVGRVAGEIAHLRKASSNGRLKVLVGGRLLGETPDLVERTGADGAAVDARTAPSIGNELLARSGPRP